jgi:uncharacterized protein YgbK (DUF1537 family)
MATQLFSKARSRTLRTEVVDMIRNAIVSGKLKPGEHLKETVLAEQMSVSRSPVRKALRQLEQEGLIVSIPNQGSFVKQFINKEDLLTNLPGEWPQDLLPEIQHQVKASRRKVVVLDDDPTGTQTVHGVPVLTRWPVEELRAELVGDSPVFYLLTNSRSLSLAQAQALNAEIGRNLVAAARQAGIEFVVVSRSDSTLRGHFPGEVETLAEALGQDLAWLVIPFFLEGGRYTVNDIHYVAEGEWLVPSGETEFARDAVFGYRSSNLRRWVAEKTRGRVPRESVAVVSIEDLRRGGPEQVVQRLAGLKQGDVCVVNAASMRDLEVFVRGLLTVEERGQRFLYRTAASFVQVRAGLFPRSLLARTDLALTGSGGGLLIVGSHVPRTTSQVNALLARMGMTSVEISVEALLDDDRCQGEIARVAQKAERALRGGEDVVIYTSRQLLRREDSESNLSIGQRVSEGLVAVVRAISTRPRYVLAKGGITSSDVATRGLGVKRALVLGQILPGAPVRQLGAESRYPGLAYIVFPGNVGDSQALVEVVRTLRKKPGF